MSKKMVALGERDFVGYGEHMPDPKWPGGAYIAVNFNLNIEAGAERSIVNGDDVSEDVLNDIGAPQQHNRRELLSETAFEYGSRRGVWRLLDLFKEFSTPLSICAVGMAVEKYPELCRAFVERGHEMVGHGYRWVDYAPMPEAEERAHIQRTIDAISKACGKRPVGWSAGRPSENTRRILAETGGFLYDRDSAADELPYWVLTPSGPHLVVPYSFETNDNRFNLHMGWSTGEQFFDYMKDAFDTLYAEGKAGSAKMLSIGVHDRILGRPARAAGLRRFLEYMSGFEKVWFCRSVDIAEHWRKHFPPPA